eukprot:116868-Amphidinium_carterae.1
MEETVPQVLRVACCPSHHLHCRSPRTSGRLMHPLRGFLVGEAANPGPARRLPRKTTTPAARSRSQLASSSPLRSTSSREGLADTCMEDTLPAPRSASEPPRNAPHALSADTLVDDTETPGGALEEAIASEPPASSSAANTAVHASPLASAFLHATQPIEALEHLLGDELEEQIPSHGIALPSAISLQRENGKEAVLCCNYLSSRKTYRYQIRSQPALLGPDRRTQFAALQAWTQQHGAALAAESRTHLKQVVLEWQDNRHQHARAPTGADHHPEAPSAGSAPLSWSQFDTISAANIRVQRHIPSSLHAALKEHLRVSWVLLQTSAPHDGGVNREQPNSYDVLFILPKLLWALPPSRAP